MKHIYYFIGIFFVFYELSWVLSPVAKAKSAFVLKELAKPNKGKKWDEFTKDYKDALKGKWYVLVFLLWIMIGLMTFNWPVFIALLLISPFFSLLGKLSGNVYYYAFIHWLVSIIGFSLGLFAIINTYHLHIDVQPYLLNLIKQWL